MTSTYFLTTIALAAAITSTASMAGSTQARPGHSEMRAEQATPVLRVVPNRSISGDAAYQWQFFSDPRALQAVVISPLGEYFLSRGDGPKQITGPAGDVLMTQSAKE